MDFLPGPLPGVTPKTILTIAGSDSSGGAGLQADLRTISLLGMHACTAVTAVTTQNTQGVLQSYPIPAAVVADQIRAVTEDIEISVAKTGMLANADTVIAVAELWASQQTKIPLVVDPVCSSMHGDQLLDDDGLKALRSVLFPHATIITPNAYEASMLTGIAVNNEQSLMEAAHRLLSYGSQWVLVKGGHVPTENDSIDFLTNGTTAHRLVIPRVQTTNDHGSGDTLAAALAVGLAYGMEMPEAVMFAKLWTVRCLGCSYPLGHGNGPVSPLWRLNAPLVNQTPPA